MKYLMHVLIMVLFLLYVQLMTNKIIAEVIKFIYPFSSSLRSKDLDLILKESAQVYSAIYYFGLFFVMEPLFIFSGCFLITDIFLHSSGRRPTLPSIGLILIFTYVVLLSVACE